MPRGELYINGKDAYRRWGVSIETAGISALMTPLPLKENVENSSALSNGKDVILEETPKIDSREVNLVVHLTASSKSEFLSRYYGFCSELKKGRVKIWISHVPNETYKCIYRNCSQFAEFVFGYGSFTLRLEEDDPTDRSVTSTDYSDASKTDEEIANE